jgi:hypothetical protein
MNLNQGIFSDFSKFFKRVGQRIRCVGDFTPACENSMNLAYLFSSNQLEKLVA